MLKSKMSILLVMGTMGALFLGFQNCGKVGHDSMNETSSVLPHPIGIKSATLGVYDGSSQVSDAISLAVSTAYEIRLNLDNVTATSVIWTANTGVSGFANCSLVGTDLLKRNLMCSTVGTAHVQAAITFSDGTSENKIFEHTVATTVTVLPPGAVVNFSIAAGTGTQPWNTVTTPAVVFIGQTLHIVNDDTGVHRLHTPGTPCPHQPANMATGQFYDCVIAATHVGTLTNLYDHNVGTTAIFYVNAIDGAANYNIRKFNIGGLMKGCVNCHGALATSAVKNASLATIKAHIAANSGGMGAITLTDDELNSIVYELNK